MDAPVAIPRVSGCGPLTGETGAGARPLRLRIFESVRAAGTVPRAGVAKDLGVSAGSVSTLTAELIEQGYLQETAARASTDTVRGRPPVALGVRPESFRVAGVKLADRELTGILLDGAGGELASVRRKATPGALPLAQQIETLAEVVESLCRDAGVSSGALDAVGVGLPGFVDHERGHVFWSPVLDTRDVGFAAAARRRIGRPVVVDNDANLVALAELWFGVGRDRPDFAVVTIEHGVGTGIVLDHRVFRGAHGVGLELGHTKVQLDGALCRCGQRGCLEAYISDYALAREAAVALGAPDGEPRTVADLIARLHDEARAGNAAAQSIFDRSRRYLALGLANLVNLFDPSLLILSGDRMRYDGPFVDDTLAEMRALALNTGNGVPPLKVHEWGTLLWAYGAGALALSRATEAALGAARDAGP